MHQRLCVCYYNNTYRNTKKLQYVCTQYVWARIHQMMNTSRDILFCNIAIESNQNEVFHSKMCSCYLFVWLVYLNVYAASLAEILKFTVLFNLHGWMKLKACRVLYVGTQSINLVPFKWTVLPFCLCSCSICRTPLKYSLFSFQYILSVDRANLNKELLTGKNIHSVFFIIQPNKKRRKTEHCQCSADSKWARCPLWSCSCREIKRESQEAIHHSGE